MLCQIVWGYETDPWSATSRNTALVGFIKGCTTRGNAPVVPIPKLDLKLKRTNLRELHDANYAGHIGYQ